MAKEISSITVYKENKITLTKLVLRICNKHQCTVQDALDALTTLFKNAVSADFDEKDVESVDESLLESLLSPSEFYKINESKDSVSNMLCGHSIQLDKGICKIIDVKGDDIIVKCNDGSKDKVSYKEYFGSAPLEEDVTINDVTQYGDNLLLTLNGHLYAYQPIKDSGKSVEDLMKSVKGMMKFSANKALQYLKKNSVLVPETSKKNK